MKKSIRKKRARQEETVEISLEDILRSRLHEFLVDAGHRVLQALLEQERTDVCGPRYEHQKNRRAYRAGHAPGQLTHGEQRVTVQGPRARTLDSEESELQTWRDLSREDPLGACALEQIVLGVSTRNYQRSLEPLPKAMNPRGGLLTS